MADNRGQLPAGISTTAQNVANTGADICTTLVSDYLAAMPADPTVNNGASITDCAAAYNTGYTTVRSATNNRITVTAPNAELGEVISVTR